MTREEAIEELYRIVENQYRSAKKDEEALSMAIKALEQETVSKEVYDHEYFLRKEFELKIDKLQRQLEALEQEPTTKNNLEVDAVSRQFMRELGATCIATRNENGELIALGAIEELPSVTPQEPILDKIRAEIVEHAKINQNLNTDRAKALCWCLKVIDKYKGESEEK